MSPCFAHAAILVFRRFRSARSPSAPMPAASLLMVALLSVVMGGCAGFGRSLEKPSVSLAGIDMLETSGWETRWRVDLRVVNPNDVDLVIRGGDCRLDMAGREMARGVIEEGDQLVPALGASVVSFQLHASVTDLMRGVWRLAEGEKPSYRLAGRIHLGGGVIPSMIPFSAEGVLDPRGKRRK